MRDGPAVVNHPPNEQTTTMDSQPGISVRHEDLQGEQRRQTSPLSREVLPIHRRHAVTNVPAEYI